MIFPMGVTSKDIFLDQQNLWLIDERLCFHTLLTSDKKLNQVPGLENTSGKERGFTTLRLVLPSPITYWAVEL
jgi:hypothetical protein